MHFDHHIFVCNNVRTDGKRPSCGLRGGDEIRDYLKKRVKELSEREGFQEQKMRVNKSGCLDRCEEGPVTVCYPQGKWFRLETKEDVDSFIENYLQNSRPEFLQDLEIIEISKEK